VERCGKKQRLRYGSLGGREEEGLKGIYIRKKKGWGKGHDQIDELKRGRYL